MGQNASPDGSQSTLPTGELFDGLKELAKVAGRQVMGRLTGGGNGGVRSLLGKAVGGVMGDGVGGLGRKAVGAVAEKGKEAVTKAPGKIAGALGGGGGDGGGGGGGAGPGKVTNIVEHIDVGVPVSVAYNQWTQFTSFPTFMKKVEKVQQTSDTELEWRAQILWSHRDWKSTIIDQVPDERIIWRSEGAKGYVDGAVTFHELAPRLTRILVTLQYHPQGFFEQVGNLWRAQGRRVRLELKHFQRHVMTHTLLHPEEAPGWRGEIHDEEVTAGPEQAGKDDGAPEERGEAKAQQDGGKPQEEQGGGEPRAEQGTEREKAEAAEKR